MTVTGHNVSFLVILCLFKSGCLPVIWDRWGALCMSVTRCPLSHNPSMLVDSDDLMDAYLHSMQQLYTL